MIHLLLPSIPVIVTLFFAILALIWCYRSLREMKALHREMEETHRQFRYFADPMVAYLQTLEEGQKWNEEAFQNFLEERYGSEFKERYLSDLQDQVAMTQIFKVERKP